MLLAEEVCFKDQKMPIHIKTYNFSMYEMNFNHTHNQSEKKSTLISTNDVDDANLVLLIPSSSELYVKFSVYIVKM